MKLIKDLGAIGISDIIVGGMSSIFWFYLATLIIPEEYGEIQFIISLAGVAFGLSMLGSRNPIIVYEAKKIELRKTLFLLSLIGGIGSSIILMIVYERIDIVFIIFGMIFSEFVIGYFLGRKSFIKYAYFQCLQKILMVIFSLTLFFVIGVDGIIYGIGISYIPAFVIILTTIKDSKLNFSLLKEHSGFIINNYSLLVIGTIKGNLDKILITPIIGFSVLGNYSIAFQIYLVMMMFSNIIYKYSLAHNASGTNLLKIKIYTVIVSVIFAIIGIFFVPIIFAMFFPNFIESIEAIVILSISVIPNTISLVVASKFLGQEKSKVVLISYLCSTIIYLVLLAILADKYQLIGISMSFLISSITHVLFLKIFNTNQNIKN